MKNKTLHVFCKVFLNIKKTTELCYNEKKMSILGMLDMDYEKLTNFKGDKIMDKLKNESSADSEENNFDTEE